MNLSRFTLWDVIVNIIPGSLAILLTISLSSVQMFNYVNLIIPESNVVSLTLFFILSYVAGRILQEGISRRFDRIVRKLINRILIWSSKSTRLSEPKSSDNEEDPDFTAGAVRSVCPSAISYFYSKMDDARDDFRSMQPTVRRLYLESAQQYFSEEDVDSYEEIDRELDDFQLFVLTQEYVVSNNLGRVDRFKIISRFYRSLYTLCVAGFISHLALLYFSTSELLNSYQIIALILFLLVIGVLSFRLCIYFEKRMVDSMISSFYISTRNGNNVQ